MFHREDLQKIATLRIDMTVLKKTHWTGEMQNPLAMPRKAPTRECSWEKSTVLMRMYTNEFGRGSDALFSLVLFQQWPNLIIPKKRVDSHLAHELVPFFGMMRLGLS